jgi:hypothetical protein
VAKRPQFRKHKGGVIKEGGYILLFGGTSKDIRCKNASDSLRIHNRSKE